MSVCLSQLGLFLWPDALEERARVLSGELGRSRGV